MAFVFSVLIAFVAYFYCFPSQLLSQARHHYFILFYYYWKISHRLTDALSQQETVRGLRKRTHAFAHVEHILKKQAILMASAPKNEREEQQLVALYALFRILELIWDNLDKLTELDHAVFEALKPVMLPVLQSVEDVLSELDQVYNDHLPAVTGRSMLLERYHFAAARIYDPSQEIGIGLVHYSNVLFGAKRVAELSEQLEKIL
jgi:hypothetical protein